MKMVLVAALCVALGGCADTVLGHCELPTELDQKSTPLDPVAGGLTLEQQHEQWAKDRAHAAKSDAHNDATIDFVHANCQ